MTERDRDLPPSGPLARLRAQLAGPRGYRRIDALLSAEDAPAAVASLAPNEMFELVHEVGFEDAQDLIALATPQQIQGCLDLDGWTKDQLEVAPLKPWLAALVEAGFEKLGHVWGALDAELRALILQRTVAVFDTSLGEGPPEDSDAPFYSTPDGYFILELRGDDDTQRLVQQLVEDLYRADPDLARHTIMAARSEPPAELEDTSYRWRSARLADLGYVDFYEALDLFRPLPADQVHVGEGSQDRAIDDGSLRLPVVVAEEVLGRSFLARAMAGIDDPSEAERLEHALVVLVNKVLAAARAKPGQAEVVRRGALYATATLSLGVETIARGDLERARDALRTIAFIRLFRVGYTIGRQLAKLATALAPRSLTAGAPAKDLVAGLCSPRPLLSRAADDPPQPGLRPIESQADVRRAGEILAALTIRIALVEGLGIDVVAMGQLPEPRPELDDHIRTALARAVMLPAEPSPRGASGPFRGEALTQSELGALRAQFADGKLTAQARDRGHAAVRARVGAAQLAAAETVVSRLVDTWLDDLDRVIGAVKDPEIDPRFVEGLIVEVQRS
jgi:hypothetical protein